jgi:hypothetical protein
VAIANLGGTPVGVTLDDDPALANVTFTATTLFSGPLPIFPFNIVSTVDTTVPGDFAFKTISAPPITDGTGNTIIIGEAPQGNVLVPGGILVAGVPEPGTMLLMGSGLAGLVAWRRRRRPTRQTQ